MMRLRTQVALTLLLLLAAVLFWPGRHAPVQAAVDVCAEAGLDVPVAECAALEALYAATDGPNWTDSSDWTASDQVCSWSGVSCVSVGGQMHVSELNLPANNLSGPLPAELADLTELKTLALADNHLSGMIPLELGTLPKLFYLDLGRNLLEGDLPYPLTAAPDSLFIFVDGNQLEGVLPEEYCTANLALIELSYNKFDTASTDACFQSLAVFSGWENTQTVPPQGVAAKVAAVAQEAGERTADTTIDLTWTPINFTEGQGGYMIFSATSSAGPFTNLRGTVNSKGLAGGQIVVSEDPTGLVFVVRSFTTAEQGKNQSTLMSAESNTAVTDSVAISLLEAGAAAPRLYLALAGPLLLLLVTAAAVWAAGRRGV